MASFRRYDNNLGAWFSTGVMNETFIQEIENNVECKINLFVRPFELINFVWTNRVHFAVFETTSFSDVQELIRCIRSIFRHLPVICLYQTDHELSSKLIENGADYVIPYTNRTELELIIKRCLDRMIQVERTTANVHSIAGWTLDIVQGQIVIPFGQSIKITLLERDVMKVFFTHAEQECGFELLAARLGIGPDEPFRHRLEVIIWRLRQKFKARFGFEIPIHSVRGFGYIFSPSQIAVDQTGRIFQRPINAEGIGGLA